MVVTPDLYCGAYILSKGGCLEQVIVDNHKNHKARPTVLFVLGGDSVIQWEREFKSGRATVEVSSLKAQMLHLKDQMFQRLRSLGLR